jgi:transposase
MASPTMIKITESIAELKALQRKYGELISKRLQILIELKKYEDTGISKRDLSNCTGINHNTILKWRKIYIAEGIAPFLVHNRKGGYKKSVFTKDEHDILSQVLNNPENGIVGYSELRKWLEKELNKPIVYITLVKYVQRKFGAKVKVGRKSHAKKDIEALEAFKKTSDQSVMK